MITSVKQKKSDRVTDEFSESKFKPNPIPLFLLASILVHGIGLVLFSLIERSQPQTQLVPETAPIDFVIVPPEESPSQTSSDPLPQKETPTNEAIEPETPTPEPIEPIAPEPIEPVSPSPAAAVPEPIPEPAPQETPAPEKIAASTPPQPEPIPEPVPPKIKPPKELKTDSLPPPEPITPPLPDNIVEEQPHSSEILSGLDPVREETEIKTPEITKLEKSPVNPDQPEDSSVATRLPPKITPTQPATPPSSPNKTPTGSGAASLLGGNLKRSYDDDKGGSFFNLDNNSSQYAANPELDVQQRLDMRNYFSEIKRRVKRNWNPNYAVQEYTTVLTFSIQRNGQIALLKVRRTSGSPEVDSEALAAVQNSGPFDPLPANYPSEMLNVEFNFNIYLYQ